MYPNFFNNVEWRCKSKAQVVGDIYVCGKTINWMVGKYVMYTTTEMETSVVNKNKHYILSQIVEK